MIGKITTRIKQVERKTWIKFGVLFAIGLIFFFTGFCLSQGYRMAPGTNISTKLFHLDIGFLRAFGISPQPPKSMDFGWGFVFVAIYLLLILHQKESRKKYRHGREYGSARWGNHKDIQPMINQDFLENAILTKTERITMENHLKQRKYERNKNVLVVGGSGSGKTRFFVLPNLLQMNCSYVVTDPKGTTLYETGEMFVKNGYVIKALNTINFSKSMHYNPFVYIHSEADILQFVTILMENTKGEGENSGDGFWLKAERLLYCALIGYIYYEGLDEEKNFSTLLTLLNACEAKEDDENWMSPTDVLFDRLKQREPDHFAVLQYTKYKMAAGKTAKSILISCGARLAPFDIKEVRELMEYDEMELDTLGDQKTAMFLIMSDSDPTFNFIFAMLESQLFNILKDKADDFYGGRLKVHVRCILDEFSNIGKIPDFEKLISTIRSREISASIILQAKSQLKSVYKDNADTIAANCDSYLFLGGIEQGTLKELSETLGKETIDMLNHSESRGSSSQNTTQYQKAGKELMTQDELTLMDGEKCILKIRGLPPFYSYKYDILEHPNYRQLAEAGINRRFDVQKYLNRLQRIAVPKEGQSFECYEVDLSASN